jgi:hypothetical protein
MPIEYRAAGFETLDELEGLLVNLNGENAELPDDGQWELAFGGTNLVRNGSRGWIIPLIFQRAVVKPAPKEEVDACPACGQLDPWISVAEMGTLAEEAVCKNCGRLKSYVV